MNSYKKLNPAFICVLTLLYGLSFSAQTARHDSTDIKKEKKPHGYKLSLLVYLRGISDNHSNTRIDENVVGNFKVLPWLHVEAGFRQGERPSAPTSYYHYKLELQTKSFWNTVRVLARISDNVISYPQPVYRKTNELVAVEGKYRLTKYFQVNGGLGYLFSAQQNHVLDALPTSQGIHVNQPIFKITASFILKNKGTIDLSYGSYDVFNPYSINQPFAQIATEQELSHVCTFFSYFRYQYNYNVFTPNNYFLCLGLRFYLM